MWHNETTALIHGPQHTCQGRGLSGPRRPKSTNSRQSGVIRVHMVQRPRWNHQLADFPQLFGNSPRGSPSVSDGPPTTCDRCCDLTDRCWRTGTRVVPHMLVRAADHLLVRAAGGLRRTMCNAKGSCIRKRSACGGSQNAIHQPICIAGTINAHSQAMMCDGSYVNDDQRAQHVGTLSLMLKHGQ